MKINYEFIANEKLNNRKMLHILGIILTTMLLCILSEEAPSLSVVKAMAKSQYISDNITANFIAISEWTSEINMHDELFEDSEITFKNRLGQMILLPEISVPVPQQSTEIAEAAIQDTADIPPAPAIIPEESAGILPEQTDVPDESGIIAVLPDEPTTIPDSIQEQEPSVEGSDNKNFLCNGFLCDASGKIIGCQDVSITDGVLCLPFDTACTGIGSNALASLSMQIYEIYIPANIVIIEEGALDGLAGLCYIEVHPDNPIYGSAEGSLYLK